MWKDIINYEKTFELSYPFTAQSNDLQWKIFGYPDPMLPLSSIIINSTSVNETYQYTLSYSYDIFNISSIFLNIVSILSSILLIAFTLGHKSVKKNDLSQGLSLFFLLGNLAVGTLVLEATLLFVQLCIKYPDMLNVSISSTSQYEVQQSIEEQIRDSTPDSVVQQERLDENFLRGNFNFFFYESQETPPTLEGEQYLPTIRCTILVALLTYARGVNSLWSCSIAASLKVIYKQLINSSPISSLNDNNESGMNKLDEDSYDRKQERSYRKLMDNIFKDNCIFLCNDPIPSSPTHSSKLKHSKYKLIFDHKEALQQAQYTDSMNYIIDTQNVEEDDMNKNLLNYESNSDEYDSDPDENYSIEKYKNMFNVEDIPTTFPPSPLIDKKNNQDKSPKDSEAKTKFSYLRTSRSLFYFNWMFPIIPSIIYILLWYLNLRHYYHSSLATAYSEEIIDSNILTYSLDFPYCNCQPTHMITTSNSYEYWKLSTAYICLFACANFMLLLLPIGTGIYSLKIYMYLLKHLSLTISKTEDTSLIKSKSDENLFDEDETERKNNSSEFGLLFNRDQKARGSKIKSQKKRKRHENDLHKKQSSSQEGNTKEKKYSKSKLQSKNQPFPKMEKF